MTKEIIDDINKHYTRLKKIKKKTEVSSTKITVVGFCSFSATWAGMT